MMSSMQDKRKLSRGSDHRVGWFSLDRAVFLVDNNFSRFTWTNLIKTSNNLFCSNLDRILCLVYGKNFTGV